MKIYKAQMVGNDIKTKIDGQVFNTNDRVSYHKNTYYYRKGDEMVNFKVYQKRRGGKYFMVIEDIGDVNKEPQFYISPFHPLLLELLELLKESKESFAETFYVDYKSSIK